MDTVTVPSEFQWMVVSLNSLLVLRSSFLLCVPPESPAELVLTEDASVVLPIAEVPYDASPEKPAHMPPSRKPDSMSALKSAQ